MLNAGLSVEVAKTPDIFKTVWLGTKEDELANSVVDSALVSLSQPVQDLKSRIGDEIGGVYSLLLSG